MYINVFLHHKIVCKDLLGQGHPEEALNLYNNILTKYPNSARAVYGKASSLNSLAAKKQSNALLEQAIAEYEVVLSLPDVPKMLFIVAGKTCAERQSFRGEQG